MFRLLFSLALSVSFFLFQKLPVYAYTSTCAREILNRFSREEQTSLSFFFQELFLNDSFAYTLFGTKPVSATGYLPWPQYGGPSILKRIHIALYNGEQLCRKCNAYFLNNNFVFKVEKDFSNEGTLIHLINKKAFLDIVATNIALFKDILGEWVTPEDLLHALLQENITVDEVLHNHVGLTGIILGYGTSNSLLYHRRQALQKAIITKYAPPMAPCDLKMSHFFSYEQKCPSHKINRLKIFPAKGFETLIDEYNALRTRLKKCGGNEDLLYHFQLPFFLGDPEDPETKCLLKEYEKTKKEIINAYRQGEFLEVTICRLIGE